MARDGPTVILRKAHEGIVENPKDKAHRSAASCRGQDLTKPQGGLLRCIHAPGARQREHCPGSSKPAEQNQDQHDNEYEAEPAAAAVAGPVEGAAPEPAKSPE